MLQGPGAGRAEPAICAGPGGQARGDLLGLRVIGWAAPHRLGLLPQPCGSLCLTTHRSTEAQERVSVLFGNACDDIFEALFALSRLKFDFPISCLQLKPITQMQALSRKCPASTGE
jgi:hypothetical protein